MSILVVFRFCELLALFHSSSRRHPLTEEGIIEGDRLDSLHGRISEKFRIDIEEHRHVDRLTPI